MDAIKGYKRITSIIITAVVTVLLFTKVIDQSTSVMLYSLASALGIYGTWDALANPPATTVTK